MGVHFFQLKNGWTLLQYNGWPWGQPLVHGLVLRSTGTVVSDVRPPDFSRKNTGQNREMWETLLQNIGDEEWFWFQPRQVHEKHVLLNPDPANLAQEADAVLTTRAGLLLGISVADCLPIWVYDHESQTVGVVHAGWRGTIRGILPETIEQIIAQGSTGKNIEIVIGPGIQQCCFEVKIDVLEEIEERYPDIFHYVVKHRYGRFFVDLVALNILLARKKHIYRVNIHPIRLCTACNPHYFYSHRRGARGRMLAFIGRMEAEGRG